jgi:hypothetical protein
VSSLHSDEELVVCPSGTTAANSLLSRVDVTPLCLWRVELSLSRKSKNNKDSRHVIAAEVTIMKAFLLYRGLPGFKLSLACWNWSLSFSDVGMTFSSVSRNGFSAFSTLCRWSSCMSCAGILCYRLVRGVKI